MTSLSSVEDRLLAANHLLIAINRVRDLAQNPLESSPQNCPIAQWLDRYEPKLSRASFSRRPTVERLNALLDCTQAPPSDTATACLDEALNSAIRSLTEQDRFKTCVSKRVETAIYDFAYGLSHEINNPLANISARAQQLITETTDERARKSLATIVDQSMRAFEMLAEMMQVVKPRSIHIESVELSECLQLAIRKAAPKLESAQIQLDISPEIPSVLVDSNRDALPEAIFILLSNAIDASKPGDEIRFDLEQPCQTRISGTNSARQGHNDTRQAFVSDKMQVSDIEYIHIRISDTGCGMAPEVAQNAFNVYYSGREHGKGLGVSLAKAKRIIESSGGTIEFDLNCSVGTVVLIKLPLSKSQKRSAPSPLKSRLFS